MRKLSDSERAFLRRVADRQGSHCFTADDHIPAPARSMLKRLDREGWIAVEDTDDGPHVLLTDMGWSAANA